MEMILNWVKSGLLFGLLGSVILMLCPNKSYQKHIGMVVGLLFVLVMMHPLMEIFQIDGSTYSAYIRNFLMLSEGQEEITESNRKLYEEAMNIQVYANLQDGGYPVKKVETMVNEQGQVEEIIISFKGEVSNLEKVELYLKNAFGQEVVIRYENK